MFEYKGYKIMWHDHDNQRRDYFVIDGDGDCIHYTGKEECCMDAIENKNFNLIERNKGHVR